MTPISQRFLVQRHVQSFTHAHIARWSLNRIKPVVINCGFRCVHEVLHRTNYFQPRRRHRVVVHRVEFTSLVQTHHGRIVGQQIENNLVEPHMTSVPVLRIARDDDAIIMAPGFQLEWPTGYDIAGFSPRAAKLLDRFLMEGPEKLMRHHADKVWDRLD